MLLRRLSPLVLALIGGVGFGLHAHAQTSVTWGNTGTDFATGANWSGGTAPANDATSAIAVFTGAPTFQPNLAADRSVAGITFQSGAGAYTLAGAGTLTLGSAGIQNQSGTTQTIATALALAGSGTMNGALNLSGAITQTGSGTWTLTGNNTMANVAVNGGTFVSQSVFSEYTTPQFGQLAVAAGATVQLVSPINSGQPHAIDRLSGAGTVNATQTSLFLGNLNGSSTFDGTILGGIVKSGSGTLTLTGDRTEATAIWGGTLQIGNGGTNGSLSVGVDISSGATLAFNRSDDVTYAPANLLTGAGGIAQNGTGVLTLGGALAYSGPTTVNAGTLRVTTATSGLPSATSVAVASGATFDVAMSGSSQGISGLSGAGRVTLSGGTLQVGYQDASSTFAGVISGSGNFEKVGNGTLQLSGANTLTGATRVYAGTLRLLATNSLSANSDVRVESTLDLNGRNQTIGALDGSSTGRVTLGGATLTVGANNHNGGFSGVISGAGSLTKTGAGGLTLFGANTYSGATNIDAGTLIVGGVNALPSSSAVTVASNALLELDRDTVVGSLAGAGNVFLNGARTLTVNTSTSSTFSGMIYDGGSGRLVKNGSGVLRLTGANQYLGGTTVNDGVLTVGAPGGSTGSLMGDVTLNRTGDGTFLSGSGSVGNVTLNSGTEIQAYGTFHTGSLTFAGDNGIDVLMSAATGTAGSLNAGWSLLSSSGAITFGGPVTVYLGSVVGQSGGAVPDWDAAANHTFLIASTDLGITGFDANQFSVNTSAFANAFTGTWAVSQMGNNLFLNYTAGASAVPEPATYAAWLGALALGTSAWRRRRASV